MRCEICRHSWLCEASKTPVCAICRFDSSAGSFSNEERSLVEQHLDLIEETTLCNSQ